MTDEIIALDLETTGLNPRTDSILEIGAVRIKNGRVEDTYAAFINIGKKIPEFIVGLTGITDEMASADRRALCAVDAALLKEQAAELGAAMANGVRVVFGSKDAVEAAKELFDTVETL